MGEARRLFAPHLPARGGEVRLDPDGVRHARVLRLREGDPVVLFDGEGREAEGSLRALDDEGARCRVAPPRHARPSAHPPITVVLSMPKAGKLDATVRMATEAGVAAVHLAWTDRAVGRPDARRLEARMQRLRRVAREAARQAGRADLPALEAPASLDEAADRAPADAARLVTDPGATASVARVLSTDAPRVWVVVGPEGGLASGERARLVERGFAPVRIAPYVLRVETAVPVAVALVTERLLEGVRAR